MAKEQKYMGPVEDGLWNFSQQDILINWILGFE